MPQGVSKTVKQRWSLSAHAIFLLAKGSRRNAGHPPEVARECALVAKARIHGDLGERAISGGEEVQRLVEAHFHGQLPRGKMEHALNETRKAHGRQIAKFCELRNFRRILHARLH